MEKKRISLEGHQTTSPLPEWIYDCASEQQTNYQAYYDLNKLLGYTPAGREYDLIVRIGRSPIEESSVAQSRG